VVGDAKTEEKVWKLVNREKKRVKKINETIKMKEWEEFYRINGESRQEGNEGE